MIPARSVLIVDDDENTREMLRVMLSAQFEVRVVSSGDDAIKSVERHRPHVVLMDLGMPRMNGAEAIRRIKADPSTRNTAIIVLTGDTRPGHLEVARAAGADSIMLKPVDPQLLAEQIEAAAAAC